MPLVDSTHAEARIIKHPGKRFRATVTMSTNLDKGAKPPFSGSGTGRVGWDPGAAAR